MQTHIVRFFASLLLVIFVTPQAFAQDADSERHEDEKAFPDHYHTGTMTPPGQESRDIKYVMSMADGEHTAWIVADVNGQELRVEMMDLEMNEGVVTYNWSPPGEEVVIACELESVEEGGWAGECISNDDDGDIGLMTMGPPMMTNHDGDDDHDEDHEHADQDESDG